MIKIIGVGNPLMGDDGVGIALLDRLERANLPAGVEVIDGGTAGVTLLGLMQGAAGVILVDAADLGRPPGTVVRVAEKDLQFRESECSLSLHQSGLEAVLTLGRELGMLPEVVLFLVQGSEAELGQGLSKPVEDALERLAIQVEAEALRLAG